MNTIMKRNQDLFGGWLDTLFNDSPVFGSEVERGFSMPAVNIKNNENSFEVEVAAPGLKKEDFDIEVNDNVMKLSVDKTTENEEKEENFTRKEFNYFNFQRSFTLPKNVIDSEKVEAVYENGILKISLPKQKEQKEFTKKISVK